MAKILIVEDEKSLNEAYRLILEKDGHKVFSAYDGQEALKKFKENTPDLVLLDLRMPKVDGIEFLKKLDHAKNYPDVDIIVFSNLDHQKEIDAAFESGASRYILKAWSSPKELSKVVSETLSSKPKKS
jgi:DNA-binding response OmpR family regulator